MYICNDCTKRNCHKTPKPISRREGRYGCAHYIPVSGGFSFLDVVIVSSPRETITLLHEHGLEVIETKKGLRVKPHGRKRHDKRRGRTRRRFNTKKQDTHGRGSTAKSKGSVSTKGG